jgi:hypothetical protein
MSSAGEFAILTGIVLTKNEEKHITACLSSLSWCDRLIVWDSFSNDATCEIAKTCGAEVVQNGFENYAQQRNAALKYAFNRELNSNIFQWVFFLDADERCTSELANEIRGVIKTDECVVWSVPRHNFIFKKLTLGAGWFPDYQARLFLLGRAGFDPVREVHETAVFDGEMGYLQQTLVHHNYEVVAQFHHKQRSYSEYEASILFKKNIRPKPQNFILQPLREFKRRFFTLRGFIDGWHGLRLSLFMAYYNFDMYRRLLRMWRDKKA